MRVKNSLDNFLGVNSLLALLDLVLVRLVTRSLSLASGALAHDRDLVC